MTGQPDSPPKYASVMAKGSDAAEKSTPESDLSDPSGLYAGVYMTPYDRAEISVQNKVALLGTETIEGGTPQKAFAVAFKDSLEQQTRTKVQIIRPSDNNGDTSQYIYYHLYTRVAEDVSKTSFNPSEPAIGCIPKAHISPPHTPATIKRCIALAERQLAYAHADLYTDISSMASIENSTYISLLRDDGVGCTAERPIVLVRSW
ncbi:hypothetical protein C8J57DRAFT_1642832 [Mycena rebaudengoi]|nr:hypothetical protein C8J57DRAFT_1642832 [Mycena rebaudengoi]